MTYQIAVLVKQVPDPNGIRIDRSTGSPATSGQMAMNSSDEYAVEEAIRIKEAHGGEIVAITAGPNSAKDVLVRALAMGADRGVHIVIDSTDHLTSLDLARLLSDQVRQVDADLVLTGQSSDDVGTGNIGPQIAELLGLPQVTSATAIECDGDTITVQRDTEFGKQRVRVSTPVAIMAMTGLNDPRYPSLKGIMAAKKKPVEAIPTATDAPAVDWGDPHAESKAADGVILQDVAPAEAAAQLVAWLREEKVIG